MFLIISITVNKKKKKEIRFSLCDNAKWLRNTAHVVCGGHHPSGTHKSANMHNSVVFKFLR